MTGIAPPGGVGCLISGSMCSGGQITPPERASLLLKFSFESCSMSTLPLFPTVVCVSECAQAFGSRCSVSGATGTLVGGAWATARAGDSNTAIVQLRMRTPQTSHVPFQRVSNAARITAWWEPEFQTGLHRPEKQRRMIGGRHYCNHPARAVQQRPRPNNDSRPIANAAAGDSGQRDRTCCKQRAARRACRSDHRIWSRRRGAFQFVCRALICCGREVVPAATRRREA